MEIKPAGKFVKKDIPSYFGAAENYVGVRRQNSIQIGTDLLNFIHTNSCTFSYNYVSVF